MEKKFFTDVIDILRGGVKKYGTAAALAAASGVSPANISHWLKGNRSPRLAELSPILDLLGVRAISPDSNASREVCFVNALVVSAGGEIAPPVAEDYIAAPLVGEVGAGPGYLPQDEIKSWFLVYKQLEAIRYRKNLIAVEIGRDSTSMLPTLSPGDIVLIDRDDRDVTRSGRVMLVLDPMDGSGMIKRVSVKVLKDDFQITYYGDNTAGYPPVLYSLKLDFAGDWDRAVVGRAIWVWSDIREK